MQMRQAPRIIPPALLKDVRQVEFVGYVANPKHKRGMPPGDATAAVAALRNMRQQPKQASSSPAVTAQNRFACQLLLLTSHAFGHAEFMLWSCFGHNPGLALALDLQAVHSVFCFADYDLALVPLSTVNLSCVCVCVLHCLLPIRLTSCQAETRNCLHQQ